MCLQDSAEKCLQGSELARLKRMILSIASREAEDDSHSKFPAAAKALQSTIVHIISQRRSRIMSSATLQEPFSTSQAIGTLSSYSLHAFAPSPYAMPKTESGQNARRRFESGAEQLCCEPSLQSSHRTTFLTNSTEATVVGREEYEVSSLE